jgi:hypothetical protein
LFTKQTISSDPFLKGYWSTGEISGGGGKSLNLHQDMIGYGLAGACLIPILVIVASLTMPSQNQALQLQFKRLIGQLAHQHSLALRYDYFY